MSRKESKPRSHRPSNPATDAAPDQAADDVESDAAGPEYEVGYRRPPLHSRFKPGMSGNPKGRPKGPRSLDEMVSGVLRKQRKVTVRGRQIRMSTLEIMVTSVTERAVRGDIAAFRALTPLLLRSFDTAEGNEALAALPEEDRQLLASYVDKIRRDEDEGGKRGGS